VLLGHLVLFGFVYPSHRSQVPDWVLDNLLDRLQHDREEIDAKVCFGTVLSREQYLHDIQVLHYRDARRPPYGRMTESEIETWTVAATKRVDRRRR
jgi:hypothetical protein